MNINDHRAAIAEVLHAIFGYPTELEWEELPEDVRDDWREDADNLLASPALARLLAAARDEARAEAWDEGALKRAQTDPACTVRNLNPYRGGAR